MEYFINVIPHGDYSGLPPTGVFIFWIIASLVSLVGYGLYLTFGPGGKDLKDRVQGEEGDGAAAGGSAAKSSGILA